MREREERLEGRRRVLVRIEGEREKREQIEKERGEKENRSFDFGFSSAQTNVVDGLSM